MLELSQSELICMQIVGLTLTGLSLAFGCGMTSPQCRSPREFYWAAVLLGVGAVIIGILT